MSKTKRTLQQLLDDQIQNLALTLRPNTVLSYRSAANLFLTYLRSAYPGISRPSQLRRDPHVLGWLRSLWEKSPPYKSGTRLIYLTHARLLLNDLAVNTKTRCAHNLIVPNDLPRLDQYLPKPLSAEDDCLLDKELHKNPDLLCDGLLLIRATGMRIGECLALTTDSLQHLGPDQWALRVPLGKLHNERWVPVDDDIRKTFAHMLSLRNLAPESGGSAQSDLLFRQSHGQRSLYQAMRFALFAAAQRAGCSTHITPHRLRHTFATGMLRAGVSLAALKELLGHKSILMTLRYVEISQNDLQRQYQQARAKIASRYVLPQLPVSHGTVIGAPLGIRTICDWLAATCHALEMYRRQLRDEHLGKKVRQISRCLVNISKKLRHLDNAAK